MVNRNEPMANDYILVEKSPDPRNIFLCSPGITALKSGRLIATFDVENRNREEKPDTWRKGRISVSDDKGKTWRCTGKFPFIHARPFAAEDKIYILGHDGDLMIICSEDEGESWSGAAKLTEGQEWHQAPCNVCYDKGNVYLVMERVIDRESTGQKYWPVDIIAPVLMRGNARANLMLKENWTFANEIRFVDMVKREYLEYMGIPFFDVPLYGRIHDPMRRGHDIDDIGWLESNVVKIEDENHYWYDENGATFHIFTRANTGRANIAALLKVTEKEDGTMETTFVAAPSGKKICFIPFPGGQMKFYILYDEKTKMYFLACSQTTDSMTKIDKLPEGRISTPDNERHRLALYFSKNCVDWCFAGMVAAGGTPKESRHYASMAVLEDDLYILSRSADKDARNAHDTNMITLHIVRDFRDLIY